MRASFEIEVKGDLEVAVSRAFNASALAIFDAMTTPEKLRQWYGLEGWTLVVCEIDLRIGGSWRFVSDLPNGQQKGQFGVYREIEPGRRLVNTENWEGLNAGETLVTTTFKETDGITTLTSTSLFASAEVRDLILNSGLEQSVGLLYQNLEAYLKN